MSTLRGESSAEIDAPIERCWAVVADLATAPDWQQGLEAMTIVERDSQGRPSVCDTVTDARFKLINCRVRFEYDPPHRMSFSRISGDIPAMDGAWTLESIGPDRTRATYALAIDAGRVGLMAKPLEKALRPLVVGGRARELAREVAARGGA